MITEVVDWVTGVAFPLDDGIEGAVAGVQLGINVRGSGGGCLVSWAGEANRASHIFLASLSMVKGSTFTAEPTW